MIQIRSLKIGVGMPKICVPIVEGSQAQIWEKAQEVTKECVDLVEWRADYFEEIDDLEKSVQTAEQLRRIIGKLPLLFTFRTAKEGGERPVSWETYERLLLRMAEGGFADLIDVKTFRGYDRGTYPLKQWNVADKCNQPVQQLIGKLQEKVTVIGSYHDFSGTPSQEEMVSRLLFMSDMGADIPKLAVMPQEREDVIRLMAATSFVDRLLPDKPVITMSMGALGAVSRLAGESFGSAVTFGCMGAPSAPGQLEVKELRRSLELLHTENEESR